MIELKITYYPSRHFPIFNNPNEHYHCSWPVHSSIDDISDGWMHLSTIVIDCLFLTYLFVAWILFLCISVQRKNGFASTIFINISLFIHWYIKWRIWESENLQNEHEEVCIDETWQHTQRNIYYV